MKKIFATAITIWLSILAFANTPIKSFFDSVDWSLTESAFIQQWPDQTVKVKHFYNEYGKFTNDYAINDIELGDWTLQADVNVNEGTQTLKFISISIPTGNDYLTTLKEAENALFAIYGSPEVVEDELSGTFVKHKNSRWYSGNYALELSLNIYSEKAYLKIMVKEHDNSANDIRVAKWGDSKKDIMAKEGKSNLSTSPDIYMFYDTIAGMSCAVGYVFTDDKLTMVKYLLDHDHSNLNDYIDDYNKLVSLLTKKYGEPYHNAPVWKNSLFKGDYSNYGLAISSGHLVYNSKWNLDRTEIDVLLGGENYKIDFQIQYLSKQFKNAQSKKQEQEALDML